MTEMTRAIAAVTPYAGYFGDVFGDYFYHNGLRGTHNAVFEGMTPGVQQTVQPYMPDHKPLGNLTPPLLQELNRATLGAWSNYLGDMYLGGGRVASTEARRQVALGSTLIMGMLAADEATWRQSPDARDATNVTLFYASVRGQLAGENTRFMQRPGLAGEPRRATQLLAKQVRRRIIGDNEDQKEALVSSLHGFADARHVQFTTGRGEIGHMLNMAFDLGEVTARAALSLTTSRPEIKDAPPREAAEVAAVALGKLGAILTHGTHVATDFRDRMPTYATAIVMNGYGPTKKALATIREHREEYALGLVHEGRVALKDGTPQQRRIFDMAVRLLRIRQMRGGIGSTEVIKESMRNDPYWSAYL